MKIVIEREKYGEKSETNDRNHQCLEDNCSLKAC
jgi:hypothetical protein